MAEVRSSQPVKVQALNSDSEKNLCIANQKFRKVFPGWYIFHRFFQVSNFLFFLGVATDERQKPGTSDTSAQQDFRRILCKRPAIQLPKQRCFDSLAQPESLPWWRPAANIYCTPFYLILGCKAEAGEAGQHRSSMIHDLRIHENTLPAVDQIITLWLFNIAMENGPFIGGLPIKNGDFPWLC